MISLTNKISRLKFTIAHWLQYACKNLIKKKKNTLGNIPDIVKINAGDLDLSSTVILFRHFSFNLTKLPN